MSTSTKQVFPIADSSVENEDFSLNHDPVLHLDLVNTPTGEEEETVIVKAHAKIYKRGKVMNAVDENDKEWKEKGCGIIKLLKHNETGKFRLVMRRDKTLKLCCNHRVQKDFAFRPKGDSKKCFLWWTAGDNSDGYPKPEILAIRFRTVEEASKFIDEMNVALNNNENNERKTAASTVESLPPHSS